MLPASFPANTARTASSCSLENSNGSKLLKTLHKLFLPGLGLLEQG